LAKVKRKMAKKFNSSCSSNVHLLQAYHELLEKKRIKKSQLLENILRKRPVRSLSGIAVVSVLTKPYSCPGKCTFCPTEKGFPKSYLKGEPAAERAFNLKFDPYLQVQKRIESLKLQGHPTDKIELRIIGATFSVYPVNYKIKFLINLFAAANKRKRARQGSIEKLKKEQLINEKTKNRIVGISIETRPDLISEKEIKSLRKLGITLVELGVQSIFDDVLKKCKRGHGVKETIEATKILKDAGFKIMYQMMPNLPGSNPEKDYKSFRAIFENPEFKPDWLKIYPCLVCKGSELYKIWKKGDFHPYSDKELLKLLVKIKKDIPYWVRIARLFRDIPSSKIEAGSKSSNMREIILEELKRKGLRCNCIRCREIKERYDPKEKIYLIREDYKASNGKEIFLSFENKQREKLFAFLRLRIPSQYFSDNKHFLPILQGSTIIREIHTYGQQIPIGEKGSAVQHKGFGKKLIKEAERITEEEFRIPKIAAISGVGARDYYRKIGYKLESEYMTKKLSLK